VPSYDTDLKLVPTLKKVKVDTFLGMLQRDVGFLYIHLYSFHKEEVLHIGALGKVLFYQ
jgi:hypothetical protein